MRESIVYIAVIAVIYQLTMLTMRTYFFAVVFLFVILLVRCLTENQNVTINNLTSILPDMCVTRDGQQIRANEIIPAEKGECYGIRCDMNLELSEEECGAVVIEQGCYGMSYDFSLLYPYCCPAARC